jgi:hypothetical protein
VILQNLGFVWARKEGSHAQYKRFADEKKKAAVVTLDEGYREINDPKIDSEHDTAVRIQPRRVLRSHQTDSKESLRSVYDRQYP